MANKIGAGALQAAWRQGIKETATALKPFPESISVDEPGTMYTPTQGEIAEQNRGGSLYGRLQEGRERAAMQSEAPTLTPDRE
jgi:hypothetical protein